MQKITDPIQLQKKSLQLKLEVIKMLAKANSGHVGGPFSMADLMTALYYNVAKIDPQNPNWPERDYILVSNGHTCPIWYAILGDLGFFDKVEFEHLREIDHLLQGHPKLGIPGVENSSGPLGHGLSQAVGIALGLQMDKKENRVFCFLSDAEQQEGQSWEAAMSAVKFGLNNLTAILDKNGVQIEGTTDEIMPLQDLKAKYQAFGWEVVEIDGHDFSQVVVKLEKPNQTNKPRIIIANTISGKDVDFMEHNPAYHDWKGNPDDVQLALSQLQSKLETLGN